MNKLKTKTLNLDNFSLMGKKTWVHDYGLMKVIEEKSSAGADYYKNNQSHRPLWDLLTYMDSTNLVVIDYYDLPKDTLNFLSWVYNKVNGDYFKSGKDLQQTNCHLKNFTQKFIKKLKAEKPHTKYKLIKKLKNDNKNINLISEGNCFLCSSRNNISTNNVQCKITLYIKLV